MADDNTITKQATEQVDSKPKATKRKKVKRSVPAGQVHVKATFNNTIITFTDTKGNKLSSSSAGACGFRGSKKVQHTLLKLLLKKQLNQQCNNTGLKRPIFTLRAQA
jgi:ribosomal protein S11